MVSADWIGWVATAVFLGSYSFKDQARLRRIQALAALLWMAYGAILHAVPIVVANLLVALVAAYSSLTRSGTAPHPAIPDSRISPAAEPDLSRIS
jgi:inner membrane protein